MNSKILKENNRPMKDWEINLFRDIIKGTYFEEAYCLLLSSGLRIGELSALKWDDIDFGKDIISVNRTMVTRFTDGKREYAFAPPKTEHARREIHLSEDVRLVLELWRDKRQELDQEFNDLGDLVFTTKSGSPVTSIDIAKDLKDIERIAKEREAEAAQKEGREVRKFVHLNSHIFRHTYLNR